MDALSCAITDIQNSLREKHRLKLLSDIQEDFYDLFCVQDASTCVNAVAYFVSSIGAMFSLPVSKSSSIFFKGQLLVALCSVVLSVDEFVSMKYSISNLVSVLWAYVSRPNQVRDVYIRHVASECLTEIEMVFPGILIDLVQDIFKIQSDPLIVSPFSLFQCCELESSYARKSYFNLLASIIDNIAHLKERVFQLTTYDVTVPDGTIPEFIPKIFHPINFNLKPSFANYESLVTCLLNNGDNQYSSTAALFRAVSVLLDNMPSCSTWTRHSIVTKVLSIPELNLPDVISKRLLLGFSNSFDILLMHTAVSITTTNHAMGQNFSSNVLNSLLESSALHVQNTHIRALAIKWSLDYFGFIDGVVEHHGFFIPYQVIDPIEIQYLKVSGLVECNAILNQPLMVETILACIRNTVAEDISLEKQPVTLMLLEQVLMKNPAAVDHVAKYLTYMLMNNVHVVDQVTIFISRLRQHADLVDSVNGVLRYIAFAISNITIPARIIEYHKILQEIAFCQDASYLCGRALLRYVNSTPKPSWINTMVVLECCEVLLKLHEIHSDSKSNCVIRVLDAISNESEFLDLKHRVDELLTMIQCLRPSELRSVFNQTAFPLNLVGIVPQIYTIENLSLILQLERQQVSLQDIKLQIYEQHNDPDILNSYLDTAKKNQDILIPLTICMKDGLTLDESSSFSELYGLVLEVETNAFTAPISPLHLPYLKHDSNKDSVFHKMELVIHPVIPRPLHLPVRSRFSLGDGFVVEGSLAPITLTLQDFFLPLPVSEPLKHLVFKELWRFHTIIRSVKCIPLYHVAMLEFLALKFEHFTVHCNDMACELDLEENWYARRIYNNDKFENGICKFECVGIYLPPCFHLLMTFTISSHSTLVRVATDSHHILTYVDDLFSQE